MAVPRPTALMLLVIALVGCGPVSAAPSKKTVVSPTRPPSATASPPNRDIALRVNFHPQRDPDWCDPADLEMWLELNGVRLPAGESQAQSTLWNYEVAHNDGFTLQQWHASPYAVATTFNHFAGRTEVGDAAFDSITDAGASLSRSLAAGQPAIVLVDKGTHYVLITGGTLGPAGVDAPPQKVIVNDPWTFSSTRDGYPAMGQGTTFAWNDFGSRFTADDPQDPGIWSGKWVVVAPGLPLKG